MALVAFHIGVEAAQLAVLVLAVLCLTFFVRVPWGQKHGRADRAVSYAAWATGQGSLRIAFLQSRSSRRLLTPKRVAGAERQSAAISASSNEESSRSWL